MGDRADAFRPHPGDSQAASCISPWSQLLSPGDLAKRPSEDSRLMDCDLDRLVRGLAMVYCCSNSAFQSAAALHHRLEGRGAPLEESVAKRFCAQALDYTDICVYAYACTFAYLSIYPSN